MIEEKQQINKREFESKLLDLARVTRVTGGGKKLSFRATIIAGDKSGKVGIGLAKGKDVEQAVRKAERQAKKNMIKVPIINETIPYSVGAKFCSARVLLRPQIKGKGIIAGGPVRTVCSLAGIKNVSAKILSKSKNKINNALATIEALKKLKKAD